MLMSLLYFNDIIIISVEDALILVQRHRCHCVMTYLFLLNDIVVIRLARSVFLLNDIIVAFLSSFGVGCRSRTFMSKVMSRFTSTPILTMQGLECHGYSDTPRFNF